MGRLPEQATPSSMGLAGASIALGGWGPGALVFLTRQGNVRADDGADVRAAGSAN